MTKTITDEKCFAFELDNKMFDIADSGPENRRYLEDLLRKARKTLKRCRSDISRGTLLAAIGRTEDVLYKSKEDMYL